MPRLPSGAVVNIEQPSLFGPGARRTDPDTSHRAAADAALHARTHRARALHALRHAGRDGLTDFELADRTGIAQTSIGKRRGELRDAGLVVDSGNRRPAPSGSAAVVWIAVQFAPPERGSF